MRTCLKCGRCCSELLPASIPIRQKDVIQANIEFWKARLNADFINPHGDMWMLVKLPCPHLTPERLCGIHNKKPEICRNHWCDRSEHETELNEAHKTDKCK